MMDLSKSKIIPAPANPSEDVPQASSPNLLTVAGGSNSAPPSAILLTSASAQRSTYHSKLTEQIGKLEIGRKSRLDLKMEDLKNVGELGQGNGGTVTKVEHLPTGTIMAKKVRTLSISYRV
jgi:mitogen-activated protein kinase kinase